MVNVDIGDTVSDVANAVGGLIGRFKKDPALGDIMLDKAGQRELQNQLAQIGLNVKETAQGMFQGGWRPAVGWTCASAFAYNFVLQPFLIFGFTMAGFGTEVEQLPELDMWAIMSVLGGMLGISHHRSGDKRKGVHKT